MIKNKFIFCLITSFINIGVCGSFLIRKGYDISCFNYFHICFSNSFNYLSE